MRAHNCWPNLSSWISSKGLACRLSSKQPTEDDQADLILNPAIDEETLDTIYSQLAEYVLQISQLEFPHIGAISKDAPET
jgi:hypothetical protein